MPYSHEAHSRAPPAVGGVDRHSLRPVGTEPGMSFRAWLIRQLFGDDMASPAELKSQIAAIGVKLDKVLATVAAQNVLIEGLRANQVTDQMVADLAQCAIELEALDTKLGA